MSCSESSCGDRRWRASKSKKKKQTKSVIRAPGPDADAFGVTREQLVTLMSYRGPDSQAGLSKLGGLETLHTALDSPTACGIVGDPCDIYRRQCYFGVNEVPRTKPRHLCRLFLCALVSNFLYILLLLLAVAFLVVGLVLQFYLRDHILAAFAYGLFLSLLIPALVAAMLFAAVNSYIEQRFHRLQCLIDAQYHAIVIRNGAKHEIESRNVVVGDLYYVSHGMILPADGILIEANDLILDESCLTGEGRCVSKCPGQDIMCYAGTSCIQGNGVVLAVAVGECTQAGRLLMNRQRKGFCGPKKKGKGKDLQCPSVEQCIPEDVYFEYDKEQSLLHRKLYRLAVLIGLVGTIIAVFIVIYLIIVLVVYRLVGRTGWSRRDIIRIPYIMATGVALAIVAIPEGLTIIVTLSVAYAVIKMAKDCILVRNLHAVENIGNISVLFVDKSGVLTTNRRSVVGLFIQGCYYNTLNQVDISQRTLKLLCKGIAVNSSYDSTLGVSMDCNSSFLMTGNRTECALLGLVHRLGVDYQEIRDLHPECGFTYVYPNNPETKMMSTVIPTSWGGFRMFTKGFPGSVLARTSFILMADGEEKPFDEAARCQTNDVLRNMACNGLQAVALATRKFDGCRDWCDECQTVRHLTLIAIVSIDDPLRCDATECSKRLACAGIQVKLMTGETLLAAQTFSHRSGLYDPSDPKQLALTCKDWNQAMCHKGSGKVDVNVMAAAVPRLRILAHCSPMEKFRIIRSLIQMEENCCGRGDIIAVTGQSLYDAPVLKVADVGIALSSGTDVSKEAADMILLDDSFCSILKAVQWGRIVYDNVSKFVQFQLTANIVLLTVMLIIVLIGHWTPFTPMQLLWINLVIDLFAAVALATDPPDQQLLNRCPYKRYRSVLSRIMKVNIFGQAIFQIIVLLLFWFFGWMLLGSEYLTEEALFREASGMTPSMQNSPDFSDFPTGTILSHPLTYPWVPELSSFPNKGEPLPLQPKPLQSTSTSRVNSTVPADPFWISFWRFLNINPNAWGCIPAFWYTQCMTFIFNLFVVMTLFNLLNSRKIHGERDKLGGITKNRRFISMWFLILLVQIIVVEGSYNVMGTRPLGWNLWMVSFFFGFLVLVWQQILDTIIRISKCYEGNDAPHFGLGACCGDHMTPQDYDLCYSPKNMSRCPEQTSKAMSSRTTCHDTAEPSFDTSTFCASPTSGSTWNAGGPKLGAPCYSRLAPPCSNPFSVCSTAPPSPSPYTGAACCVGTRSPSPLSSDPCVLPGGQYMPSAPPPCEQTQLYPPVQDLTVVLASVAPSSSAVQSTACPPPLPPCDSPSPVSTGPSEPAPSPQCPSASPTTPTTINSPACNPVKGEVSVLSRPQPPAGDHAGRGRKKSRGEKSGKSSKKRPSASPAKSPSGTKEKQPKKDRRKEPVALSDDCSVVPALKTNDAAAALLSEIPSLGCGEQAGVVGIMAMPSSSSKQDDQPQTLLGGDPSFPRGLLFVGEDQRTEVGMNAPTTVTTAVDETVDCGGVNQDGKIAEVRSTGEFESGDPVAVDDTTNIDSTVAATATSTADKKTREDRRQRSSHKRQKKPKKQQGKTDDYEE